MGLSMYINDYDEMLPGAEEDGKADVHTLDYGLEPFGVANSFCQLSNLLKNYVANENIWYCPTMGDSVEKVVCEWRNVVRR